MNYLIFSPPGITNALLLTQYIQHFSITDNAEKAKLFSGTVVIVLNDYTYKQSNHTELIKYRISNNLRTKLIIDRTDEILTSEQYAEFVPIFDLCDRENVLLINLKIANYKNTHCDFYVPYNNLTVNAYELHAARHILDKKLYVDSTPVSKRPICLNVLLSKLKSRKVRFIIAHRLYHAGLLENAVASLLVTPEHTEYLKEAFPEYYSEGFFDCIAKKRGPIDGAAVFTTEDDGTMSCGTAYPFSHEIFKNSSVSYISETYDVYEPSDYEGPTNHPILITEKTWRPIMSRHPFIIQAIPETLDELKNLGYQSFSSIIDESYNTYTKHDWSHIDNTIAAAKELLNKIPTHHAQIQEIVDFNYNHFLTRAKQQIVQIESYLYDFIVK